MENKAIENSEVGVILKYNRSSDIIQELLAKIVQGELLTGTTLPTVEDLAEKYAVSRTVMREVYLALASKRLVKSVPRLGTVIQPSDQWDWWDKDILFVAVQNKGNNSKVKELNQFRLMLEPAVSEQAALTASDQDIERMKLSLEMLKSSIESLEQWAVADVKFHECILNATHNDLMIQLGKNLSRPFYNGRLQVKNENFLKNINFDVQEQIIQAIESRQAPLARHFMYHLILIQSEY